MKELNISRFQSTVEGAVASTSTGGENSTATGENASTTGENGSTGAENSVGGENSSGESSSLVGANTSSLSQPASIMRCTSFHCCFLVYFGEYQHPPAHSKEGGGAHCQFLKIIAHFWYINS